MKSIEILKVIVDSSKFRGSILYFDGCYDSEEEMVTSIWGEETACIVRNKLKGEEVLMTREPLSSLNEKTPFADVVVAVVDNDEVTARYLYNIEG